MTNIKLIIFLIIANIIFAQSSTARVEGSHTLTQGDGVGIYQAVDLCLKQAIINGVFNYLDTKHDFEDEQNIPRYADSIQLSFTEGKGTCGVLNIKDGNVR